MAVRENKEMRIRKGTALYEQVCGWLSDPGVDTMSVVLVKDDGHGCFGAILSDASNGLYDHYIVVSTIDDIT